MDGIEDAGGKEESERDGKDGRKDEKGVDMAWGTSVEENAKI